MDNPRGGRKRPVKKKTYARTSLFFGAAVRHFIARRPHFASTGTPFKRALVAGGFLFKQKKERAYFFGELAQIYVDFSLFFSCRPSLCRASWYGHRALSGGQLGRKGGGGGIAARAFF
jgi:hypothetical protein